MYGTVFNPTRRPILGDEYLRLLEQYKPILEWDAETEESYFTFENEDGEGEVWYPSLYSIKYFFLVWTD
jgi:spore germination protein YaaH